MAFSVTFPLRRLAAALLLGWALAASALADPGLWVARSKHATVYLFGTLHVLSADQKDWSFPALEEAIARSERLSIELVDDDPASMAPLIQRYGIDPAHPLSSKLSEEEKQSLAAAATAARVPGGVAALDSMRPWLAALVLAVAPIQQAGLDPNFGVDRQLRRRMEQAGKPVDGLEHAEQQLRMLADLSEAQQLDLLRSVFQEMDEVPALIEAMITAWQQGDAEALGELVNKSLRESNPVLYQKLIVQRNQVWARSIAERMRRPGVSFVAVGAGHLAGADSLQAALRKLGIEVTRVRTTPAAASRLPFAHHG